MLTLMIGYNQHFVNVAIEDHLWCYNLDLRFMIVAFTVQIPLEYVFEIVSGKVLATPKITHKRQSG